MDWKQPDDGPLGISVITYLWVAFLACWGGVVSYAGRVKRGEIHKFSLMEFCGELATSAFAGVITYLLCQASGISDLFTAAMVGISGHMGSRAIFQMERWAKKRFQ